MFEGAPFYHVLDGEDETACGVPCTSMSAPGGRRPKVTSSKPFGVMPCKRCLKALDRLPEATESDGRPNPPAGQGRIEAGDWVQVVVSPQAGKVGRVAGVVRARGETDSSAVFKVKFSDGGEAGYVGANLKKVNP
jgi:hypothetical protein